MPKVESSREFYEEYKDTDIEETMDLVLFAETEDKQDFSMLSDFILQRKQKNTIAQRGFE